MPRGGSRPGAGRKPKEGSIPRKKAAAKLPAAHSATGVKSPDAPATWPFGAQPEVPVTVVGPELSPLDYLLSVVRNEFAEEKVRIQAASIAAPYVHAKQADASAKKDVKADAAKKAGGGKFAAATPPKLVVNNRGH